MLYDPTMLPTLPDGVELDDKARALFPNVPLTAIGVQGVYGEVEEEFSFAGCASLLMSTAAIHAEPQWPPRALDDAIGMIFALPRRADVLFALCRDRSPQAGSAASPA